MKFKKLGTNYFFNLKRYFLKFVLNMQKLPTCRHYEEHDLLEKLYQIEGPFVGEVEGLTLRLCQHLLLKLYPKAPWWLFFLWWRLKSTSQIKKKYKYSLHLKLSHTWTCEICSLCLILCLGNSELQTQLRSGPTVWFSPPMQPLTAECQTGEHCHDTLFGMTQPWIWTHDFPGRTLLH